MKTLLSWIIGFFRGPPEPLCSICKRWIGSHGIDGNVEAWVDSKPVCRSCCQKNGICPWYYKDTGARHDSHPSRHPAEE